MITDESVHSLVKPLTNAILLVDSFSIQYKELCTGEMQAELEIIANELSRMSDILKQTLIQK